MALADLARSRSGKHSFEQAHMKGGRHLPQLFQRGRADAATRRGHRPDERRVVIAVGNEAQIGDHILDLGLVEKGLAAR